MTKVKEGDIIFSIYKRKLVSVNVTKSSCMDANRPKALDNINLWEKEGWLINVEYDKLDNPIYIEYNIEEILKLCPSRYSPFTKQGRGRQGYLFEIGNALGDYLLSLVNNKDQFEEK